MSMNNPKQCCSRLALAHWCYNFSYSSIKMSHFQAMYGYPSPTTERTLLETITIALVREL